MFYRLKNNVFAKSALLCSIFLIIFGADISSAEDYTASGRDIVYVRDGGSGNGTSWADALDNLPSTLIRNTIYMIADGKYGSYLFGDAISGADRIYIVKATEDDHGTDNGWSSSYGDGKAAWDRWEFNTTGYYTFDGQTGGGPGAWETGHGFEIEAKWGSEETAGRAIEINYDQTATNLNFYHIEIHPEVSLQGYGHLFYDTFSTNVSDVTFSHCYFHDVYGCFIYTREADTITLEYNKFKINYSSSAHHAETWADSGSDNIIIRYNIFEDNDGTSHIVGLQSAGYMDNWEIYGNLFYSTRTQETATPNGIIRVLDDAGNTTWARNWMICNNTIANLEGGYFGGGIMMDPGSTGNVAYNNIWYNNENAMLIDSPPELTHDYNYFSNQINPPDEINGKIDNNNPFKDSENHDYTLSEGIEGTALSTRYNTDMYGNVRGQDGVWDRGAFEYVTTLPLETAPPTNLSATRKLIPVSITASSNDGNIPENTVDGDLGTRWSAEGTEEWIEYDLGSNKVLHSVEIAWYLGQTQIADFGLETSVDRITWTQHYRGNSGGTDNLERYKIISQIPVRYVRIMGYGNNINDWNSITEVEINEYLP